MNPSPTAPALELRSVHQVFGALRAIDDVSITVTPGQRHAILGSNGAGKTTLFNAITGDFLPSSGQILFYGQDITRMPAHRRIRLGLRRTYQSSQLFQELTVMDNLLLAVQGVSDARMRMRRRGAADASVQASLHLLELCKLASLRQQQVKTLSHGQQRQLDIAMALVGTPQLILFDEPAAGLSPHERSELLATLSNLPAEIGFLIIEHDLDIALALAQVVTVMHQGKVICQGSPAEIQSNEQVHAIYFGKQRHD